MRRRRPFKVLAVHSCEEPSLFKRIGHNFSFKTFWYSIVYYFLGYWRGYKFKERVVILPKSSNWTLSLFDHNALVPGYSSCQNRYAPEVVASNALLSESNNSLGLESFSEKKRYLRMFKNSCNKSLVECWPTKLFE